LEPERADDNHVVEDHLFSGGIVSVWANISSSGGNACSGYVGFSA
jgi:hypothetical protein